jgi:hypothetical protein
MFCLLEAIKDRPRISNQCCSALMKLASSLEPSTMQEQRSNALTPFFKDVMTILVSNSERDDFMGTGVDLVQASYVAMTSIVQNSCSDSNEITY